MSPILSSREVELLSDEGWETNVWLHHEDGLPLCVIKTFDRDDGSEMGYIFDEELKQKLEETYAAFCRQYGDFIVHQVITPRTDKPGRYLVEQDYIPGRRGEGHPFGVFMHRREQLRTNSRMQLLLLVDLIKESFRRYKEEHLTDPNENIALDLHGRRNLAIDLNGDVKYVDTGLRSRQFYEIFEEIPEMEEYYLAKVLLIEILAGRIYEDLQDDPFYEHILEVVFEFNRDRGHIFDETHDDFEIHLRRYIRRWEEPRSVND